MRRAGLERKGLSDFQEVPDAKELRHVYIPVSLHV